MKLISRWQFFSPYGQQASGRMCESCCFVCTVSPRWPPTDGSVKTFSRAATHAKNPLSRKQNTQVRVEKSVVKTFESFDFAEVMQTCSFHELYWRWRPITGPNVTNSDWFPAASPQHYITIMIQQLLLTLLHEASCNKNPNGEATRAL